MYLAGRQLQRNTLQAFDMIDEMVVYSRAKVILEFLKRPRPAANVRWQNETSQALQARSDVRTKPACRQLRFSLISERAPVGFLMNSISRYNFRNKFTLSTDKL